jgi:hypothetical protein
MQNVGAGVSRRSRRGTHGYLKAPAIALLAILIPPALVAGAEQDFSAIDAHVLAIERPASGNSAEFVQRLVEPARNDLERVRAIAWWIASHIEYDHEMYRVGVAQQKSGQSPVQAIIANRPPEVMRRGKAVCAGYAALFVSCCKTVGIEAVEVSGSTRYSEDGHQWNAVRIGGDWRLLDISYMASGAGNARREGGRPLDFYFLTPPERFIFSHFPRDAKWQLLPNPVSRREFDAVPAVLPPLLMMLGQPHQLREAAQRGVQEFVSAAMPEALSLTLVDVPLSRRLEPGRTYRFRIRAKAVAAIHINDGGRVQTLQKRGDLFQGEVTPAGSFLRVGVQGPTASDPIAGILDYQVDGNEAAAPVPNRDDAGDEIVRLINDARRKAGVGPLNRDATLDASASAHAQEMARQRGSPAKEFCLVAAVDTSDAAVNTQLVARFVGSMMEDGRRRAWACAVSHGRIGVGIVRQEGRAYFCIEFR